MKFDERDGPQRPGCEMFSNLHAIFWMHFPVSFHRNKDEFSRNSVSKDTIMADISLIDYSYCFFLSHFYYLEAENRRTFSILEVF